MPKELKKKAQVDNQSRVGVDFEMLKVDSIKPPPPPGQQLPDSKNLGQKTNNTVQSQSNADKVAINKPLRPPRPLTQKKKQKRGWSCLRDRKGCWRNTEDR